jgi:hypothetical protein
VVLEHIVSRGSVVDDSFVLAADVEINWLDSGREEADIRIALTQLLLLLLFPKH